MNKPSQAPKYPGIPEAMDGNTAVIMCERESSDAAGAYPITPVHPDGRVLGGNGRSRAY
jgi:pyruvate-ferredoxin/flavodoxin oxidoreductase